MKLFLLFLFFVLSLFCVFLYAKNLRNTFPPFESSITAIPIETQKIMEKYTWRPECPVSLSDLVQIKLSYWGFDHKTHQGILIVNKDVASEVVNIFKAIYSQQFPIERMEPMDIFKGDDDAAMEANNTSAFNCRSVTGKPGVFSVHSYGRAIDINTLINPYVKDNVVLPPAGKKYVDRTKEYPGKITRDSFIYNQFIKYGWTWGGDWHDLKDYQHFEKKIYPPVFGPDGFGELKLGMHWQKGNPVDRLIHFSGNPASFDSCISGNLIAAKNEPTEPFAGASLSKKMGLVSLSVYKDVYTKEGIGIGSTITEVKKAYPDLDLNAVKADLLPPTVKVPQNKNAYYQMDFADNKISVMQIVLNKQNCFD